MESNVGLSGFMNVRKLSREQLQKEANRRVFWWHVRNWIGHRKRELFWTIFVIWCLPALKWLMPALSVAHGQLRMKVRRGDGSVEDYGVVGRFLVTTAGKKYVASTFANTAEPELFKYHGYGTGTVAANVADTALGTELTTQYATDSTRPTGSQASDGTVVTYTTVATLSPDSGGTLAITEWGLFTAITAGTLLDRQVFSAVNLVAGSDSLQTTYVLTIS